MGGPVLQAGFILACVSGGKIGMTLLWDANSTVKSYAFPGRTPNFF